MKGIDLQVTSLTKIGLSVPEARVYLALVELKESKTGLLCEKSGVASSKMYSVLESLLDKGFVSYRVQNNAKVFIASSPSILKDKFAEKEKKLSEEKNSLFSLIDELKNREQAELPFSRYRYFEGISGVRSLWVELTEDLAHVSKNDAILTYTGHRKAYENILGWYDEFHRVRFKRKIPFRLICAPEEKVLAEVRNTQLSTVRYLPLTNDAEWAIVGNKLIIQYINQKVPRAFMIEDTIFVLTFKQVFDQLWELADLKEKLKKN